MEAGLFVVVMWVLTALLMYWIIRLGVRHGTLDAYRIDRTDQRIAAMKAGAARHDGAPGEVDRT